MAEVPSDKSRTREQDLIILQQISDISGRINLLKHQAALNIPTSSPNTTSNTAAAHGRSSSPASHRPWNKYIAPHAKTGTDNTPQSEWRNARVAPYGGVVLNGRGHAHAQAYHQTRAHLTNRGRGRGFTRGRATPITQHRNRTLVLNQKTAGSTQAEGLGDPSDEEDGARFIRKRDRHMQLINTTVYEKEAQTRIKALEETRRIKALAADRREQAQIARYLADRGGRARGRGRGMGGASVVAAPMVLTIDGLRFCVLQKGGKLARMREKQDEGAATTASPRRAVVGGVTFVRSQNGNLYRAGIAKAKMGRGGTKRVNRPCERFTSTGQCELGPLCRYVHNADKVAICRTFLQNGTCPANPCDLSHDPRPERCPVCVHFLRGQCSKEDCRYAHVRVASSAAVCRAFAQLGYCEQGAECQERHIRECPDYARSGTCQKPRCRLPHVDRAGTMREKKDEGDGDKNTEGESEQDMEDEMEDVDGDEDDEDLDSDGMEEFWGPSTEQGAHSGLSQGDDYVRF